MVVHIFPASACSAVWVCFTGCKYFVDWITDIRLKLKLSSLSISFRAEPFLCVSILLFFLRDLFSFHWIQRRSKNVFSLISCKFPEILHFIWWITESLLLTISIVLFLSNNKCFKMLWSMPELYGNWGQASVLYHWLSQRGNYQTSHFMPRICTCMPKWCIKFGRCGPSLIQAAQPKRFC